MKNQDHIGRWEGTTAARTVSVFDMVSLIVRKRKLIAGCLAVVLLPSLVILLLLPNQYRSTASILPENSGDQMADIKFLASLAGQQLQASGSSELYPTVLESNLIRDAVLEAQYCFEYDGSDSCTTLAAYLGLPNRDKLRASLADMTSVDIDKKTGTVRLGVTTEYPQLSQAVLERYVLELEKYNLDSRNSRAQQVEQYLAREVRARRAELQTAQDSLRLFRENNRNWQQTSHPRTLAEAARLGREVTIREQAYAYLCGELEAARLQVQRDTPILRLLDKPSLPELKAGPFRLKILSALTLLTLLISIFLAAVVESLQSRAQAREQKSYRRLRDDITAAFPAVSRVVMKSTPLAGSSRVESETTLTE